MNIQTSELHDQRPIEVGIDLKPIKALLYGGTLEGEMRYTEIQGRAALDLHQVMDKKKIQEKLGGQLGKLF